MTVELLVVGIGCTRGTPSAVLAEGVDAVLSRHGLSSTSVRALASVDTKRDEEGLSILAHERGWTLTLYSPEALAVAARAPSSLRVQQTVGTPAVAEPAALLAGGTASLLVPKSIHRDASSGHSVTIAVARLQSAHA